LITLHRHLKKRTRSAYRRLQASLEGLTEEGATHGARPDWHRYRHGTGLDGSIRGILVHLGVWKRAAARGVCTGAFPDAETLVPAPGDLPALLAWLDAGHAELARTLDDLGEDDLERVVDWEGYAMTAAEAFAHLIEHDQYHTGQVNLLRQQMGHALPE